MGLFGGVVCNLLMICVGCLTFMRLRVYEGMIVLHWDA